MEEVLHARFYNIQENEQKRYLIPNRSQAKTSGTNSAKVHDVGKGIDVSQITCFH